MQFSQRTRTLLISTIQFLVLASASISVTHAAESDYTSQMLLNTNGQSLTLLLRPSRVMENLSVVDNNGSTLQSGTNSYTGVIKGDPNSWVRLTQSGNSLDGVISRFGKRFQLQQRHQQPAQIRPLAGNHDLRVSITANNSSDRILLNNVLSSEVTRVANIGIVVDSTYNELHNGKGLEYALSVINSVDGIYREEFGLALQVDTAINVVDAATDPFNYGSVEIETMLRNFRDYRIQSPLLDQSVSLVHLFTGNRPTDVPVGLAWIDTACRPDGYDVGLSTPYKHDILLVAHEIAHNLGALHDTETSCAAATDKVMWPYISSGTSQQFSSCTIETVKRTIAESCHAEAIDLEVAVAVDRDNTVKATVRNTDTVRANPAATLAIDLPAGGSATTVQGDCDHALVHSDQIECSIGELPPGADSVVILQVDTELSSELFATVEPDNFVDVSTHNNSITINTRTEQDHSIDNNVARNVTLTVIDEQEARVNTNEFSRNSLAGSSGGNSGGGTLSVQSLLLLLTILVIGNSGRSHRETGTV